MVGFHNGRGTAPAPRSIITHYSTYTTQQVVGRDAPFGTVQHLIGWHWQRRKSGRVPRLKGL